MAEYNYVDIIYPKIKNGMTDEVESVFKAQYKCFLREIHRHINGVRDSLRLYYRHKTLAFILWNYLYPDRPGAEFPFQNRDEVKESYRISSEVVSPIPVISPDHIDHARRLFRDKYNAGLTDTCFIGSLYIEVMIKVIESLWDNRTTSFTWPYGISEMKYWKDRMIDVIRMNNEQIGFVYKDTVFCVDPNFRELNGPAIIDPNIKKPKIQIINNEQPKEVKTVVPKYVREDQFIREMCVGSLNDRTPIDLIRREYIKWMDICYPDKTKVDIRALGRKLTAFKFEKSRNSSGILYHLKIQTNDN